MRVRLFKKSADFGLTLRFLVLLYSLPLAEKSPFKEKPLMGEKPPGCRHEVRRIVILLNKGLAEPPQDQHLVTQRHLTCLRHLGYLMCVFWSWWTQRLH